MKCAAEFPRHTFLLPITKSPFLEQLTPKTVISSERSESRNLHTFDTIFGHFSEKIPRFRFSKLWYACHWQAYLSNSLRYTRDDKVFLICKLPDKQEWAQPGVEPGEVRCVARITRQPVPKLSAGTARSLIPNCKLLYLCCISLQAVLEYCVACYIF